jgi:MATE family, multidrug efflux pump
VDRITVHSTHSGFGACKLLLEGPIARTLVRLAAPNVVVMAVQSAVDAAEAYFLGWLGADALAGVSLVFPLLMVSSWTPVARLDTGW